MIAMKLYQLITIKYYILVFKRMSFFNDIHTRESSKRCKGRIIALIAKIIYSSFHLLLIN